MFTLPQLLIGLTVLAITMLAVAFVGYRPPTPLKALRKKEEEMIEQAKKEAEQILQDARNGLDEVKKKAKEENTAITEQIKRMETLLQTKEGFFNKRELRCREIESTLERKKTMVRELSDQSNSFETQVETELVNRSGTRKEALKEMLVSKYEFEILAEKDKKIAKFEEFAKDIGKRRAQEILVEAIQKYSAPTSVEQKSSAIKVLREEIKGQFLANNGEAIAFFEELAEVDLIFNDLPKTIHVSAYNLVKRHIATKAMEHLVKKRSPISKEAIQKALKEAEKETDAIIMDTGRDVAKSLKLKDPHPELLRIIGRLNFRTSYGQNILKHSLEVAALATTLAYELGADVETCRLAAFFHDIGKAIDYEVEGAHDDLSKQILEQYGFPEAVVYAAYAHHDKVPANTIPAMIVKAADAISAGRPGARQESLQKYLERLSVLEETALSFPGVQKSFAISAGREVRVIADPEKLDDQGVIALAKDVARKIEEDLTYPGKIKVNVIRKTRSIDYAR